MSWNYWQTKYLVTLGLSTRLAGPETRGARSRPMPARAVTLWPVYRLCNNKQISLQLFLPLSLSLPIFLPLSLPLSLSIYIRIKPWAYDKRKHSVQQVLGRRSRSSLRKHQKPTARAWLQRALTASSLYPLASLDSEWICFTLRETTSATHRGEKCM